MVLRLLQYGFAKENAEVAKAKEEAVEAICANPANAPLIMAFKEVSKVSPKTFMSIIRIWGVLFGPLSRYRDYFRFCLVLLRRGEP